MTKTGLLAVLGFVACMLGLFAWTTDGNVLWGVGGLAALFLCFLISDALVPTPKDKKDDK